MCIRDRIGVRDFAALAAVSAVFSVSTTYLVYESYRYIGVGLATTLHFLYPMFTVLFGWVLFRQRPDRYKAAALVLATLGVALATGSSDSYAATGIVLALISAMTYAGYLQGIEHLSLIHI